MEGIELPGLDLSALLSGKPEKIGVEQTSTQHSGVFPIGGGREEQVQETPEEQKARETAELGKKKPLNLNEKPSIGIQEETEEQVEDTTEEAKTSPIKALGEFLKTKGLVDYKDEEFKDEDDFIAEQWTKSRDTAVESWKDSLPEEVKNIITNYQDGVPIGALLNKEREIFEYSQVDPTALKDNTELQKTLVNNYYAEIGWTAADIDEKITELTDTGVLEKEAGRSLNKLLDLSNKQKTELIEKAKYEKTQKESAYKEQVNKLQTTLKDTKEFIPGLPANDAEKKLVLEGITKFDRTGKNKVMEFMEKPENYILISYLANVLKGDFSKVKATAKTAAVGELKKVLSSTPEKKSAFGSVDTSIIRKSLNI